MFALSYTLSELLYELMAKLAVQRYVSKRASYEDVHNLLLTK